MNPLNLDMPRTALVLVDLMPRIIALPTVPHSGEQVLERCLRLAARSASAAGSSCGCGSSGPGRSSRTGSELAVEPGDGDVVVVKKAWARSPPAASTRSCGIDVETFIRGRVHRSCAGHGYRVFVTDACRASTARHDFAVEYVFGEVVTTDELLAQLPTLE